MATGGEFNRQLTDKEIVALAAAIPAGSMMAIAEGYMNISDATIKNKKYDNKDDAEAFNREVLRLWKNKSSASDQVKVINCFAYL